MSDDRKATGTFVYTVKTKTGYHLKMTGNVFGPKHGNVIVAALDSQLPDDEDLLVAAPDLLDALSELLEANSYYFPTGNPWGDKARAAIAKATLSNDRQSVGGEADV